MLGCQSSVMIVGSESFQNHCILEELPVGIRIAWCVTLTAPLQYSLISFRGVRTMTLMRLRSLRKRGILVAEGQWNDRAYLLNSSTFKTSYCSSSPRYIIHSGDYADRTSRTYKADEDAVWRATKEDHTDILRCCHQCTFICVEGRVV